VGDSDGCAGVCFASASAPVMVRGARLEPGEKPLPVLPGSNAEWIRGFDYA
jgi:hypothetical protein